MSWSEADLARHLARQQGQPLPRPLLTAEDLAPEWRFQARIVAIAEAQGYRCFHAHRNKRNAAGYPDLTMAPPSRALPLLCVEVKTNTGIVEPEQEAWLAALHNPPWVIAEVWRPALWDHVCERLGYR